MRKRFFGVFKSVFLHDAGTKLLSLGIAVLLWTYADSVNTADVVVEKVPIALELPGKIAVLGLTDDAGRETMTISVTIRGPKAQIADLDRTRIVCTPRLALDPAQVGDELTLEHSLSRDDFNIPSGLTLSFVSQKLRLTVATIREEEVPVRTEGCFIGAPAEGFEQSGEPVAEPSKVRVRGPAKAFNGPEKWIKAANISLDKRDADFSSRVPLNEYMNNVSIVTDKDVLVRVSIRPVPITDVLEKVRVFVLAPSGTTKRSFTVEPSEISVTVQGPRRLVEELKKEYSKTEPSKTRLFFAYVDATDPLLPRTGNKLPVAFYISPKLSKDIIVRDMSTQVTLTITEDEE